ncbi:MAG TPA: TadE/TadG family type IV pilus assembly protein [Rhizomicrobium sp.]|nr:TadE/TadG family type IV pilus assembly protein [Rhizomicrobium sp.]
MMRARDIHGEYFRRLRVRLARAISDFAAAKRGLAAIEFAVIAPVMAMMVMCAVDLGLAINRHMQVEDAAQAGAEYAALHGFDATSISSAVTSATSWTGISASPAPTQFCGCPGATSITPATCGSTCASGNNAAVYVSVGASGTYSTIVHCPLIPATFAFASKSTMRIQ